MSSYQDYKNKALQNSEVKKEYAALQPVNLIAYNRKIERRWKKKLMLQILY